MSRIKSIGIIAEDDSDFESTKIIIRRIIGIDKMPFKKAIGNGCGKVRRKALDYANNLQKKGCDLIILIHDLDRHDVTSLREDLEGKLKSASVFNRFICIPTEEIEAWFLSDPHGIKDALNLKRIPNISGKPETISSPKEKLGECVYLCSNKEKIYLNTKHNEILSKTISINLMRQKCPSFDLLYSFISEHKY